MTLPDSVIDQKSVPGWKSKTKKVVRFAQVLLGNMILHSKIQTNDLDYVKKDHMMKNLAPEKVRAWGESPPPLLSCLLLDPIKAIQDFIKILMILPYTSRRSRPLIIFSRTAENFETRLRLYDYFKLSLVVLTNMIKTF